MAGRVQSMHAGIWNWAPLRAKPPIARLLYMFLRANQRTGISGLYVAPRDVLAVEVGLDLEAFNAALRELGAAPELVRYDDDTGTLWVRHKLRQELELSSTGQVSWKTMSAVQREVLDAPTMREAFVAQYGDQVHEMTGGKTRLRVGAAPPVEPESTGGGLGEQDVDAVLSAFLRDGVPALRMDTRSHRERARAALSRDGATLYEVLAVIEHRYREWVSGPDADARSRKWFRPSTVLGEKFDEYADAARAAGVVALHSTASQEAWLSVLGKLLPTLRTHERALFEGTVCGAEQAGEIKVLFPTERALEAFRRSYIHDTIDRVATEALGVPTRIRCGLGVEQ